MSGYERFKVKAYCICGGVMTGSGAGEIKAVAELRTAFWSVHSGDGHGETDARTASAARRRVELQYEREVGI